LRSAVGTLLAVHCRRPPVIRGDPRASEEGGRERPPAPMTSSSPYRRDAATPLWQPRTRTDRTRAGVAGRRPGTLSPWRRNPVLSERCPLCSAAGNAPLSRPVRRDPVRWTRSNPRSAAAQLSVDIGTSGSVNPAAGFVAQTGALAIPTAANRCFPSHAARHGLAAVDEIELDQVTVGPLIGHKPGLETLVWIASLCSR
jgi:hypothetical protein